MPIFYSKELNRISLYTEKRHVLIKMTEEEGVDRQQKQLEYEDATEKNDVCFKHQHILSLSSSKNKITDCSSSNHENAAEKGVHSGNGQADINSYNLGKF